VVKLVDDVRPGLAIDLHEGWDDDYYLFVSGACGSDGEATTEVERRVESAVIAALRAEGARASSLSELVPNMPEEHRRRLTPLGAERLAWRWDPVESSPWGVGFLPYARRWGMAVKTEIGRWTALADRVRYQTAGSIAAVRAYGSAMIQSRDG